MKITTFKNLVAGVFTACLATLSAQAPVAGFTISPNPVCSGQTVQVTDLSTGNPTSWSYTLSGFGPNGGSTSTLQSPVFNFNFQGTFTISLIASNASGASALVTQTVQVLASPGVNLSPATQTTCIGGNVNSVSVTAGGGGGTAGLTYSWSTGATSSVISLPSQANTTIVTCVITGTNGCMSTRNATINVSTPTASIISNPVNICPGTSSTLTAIGNGGGPYSYTWSTVANTRSTTASVAGVYNVTVTNAAGCTATQSISLATSSTLQLNVLSNGTVVCAGNTLILQATGASNYTWSTGAVTANNPVTPSTTTTYSVYGVIGTCSGTTAVTVSVNVTPTITVSSNIAQLCAGKSATLTANGAGTYTWVPFATVQSSLVVSPQANTTYTVRGSNPGCPARTGTITLSVLPSPSVQVISNGAAICNGDEVSLAASGAQSYTWSTGGNSAIIAVSPSVTTTFSLIGSGANGCESSAFFTQTVNACTGIAFNSKANVIYSVYPSPAADVITVKGSDLKALIVYNLQGQVLLSIAVSGTESHIDMTSVIDGLYILKVEGTNGSVKMERILVRH